MWTTHAYLHALFGHGAPLDGVVLSRYSWDYIWSQRKKRKKLPSFRLNVFIQAKRPQYGRYAPKAMRDLGLKSPFWRFEVTPHQQLALEKLQANLKSRAIVCYACPAFHQESKLHKWTVEPQMVENSTFPDVALLKGHSAWNFSEPGAHGVANAEPVAVQSAPLINRIHSLIQTEISGDESPIESLELLSAAVRKVMGDDATDSLLRARFAEGSRTIREIADDLTEGSAGDNGRGVVAFGDVLLFCYLHRLKWFVAG